MKKDFEKNAVEQVVRITRSAPVDEYIPERYTQEDLEKLMVRSIIKEAKLKQFFR